jgi:biotin carboxyl carrier protein
MRHVFDIDSAEHALWIARTATGSLMLHEGGSSAVALEALGGSRHALTVDGRREIVHVVVDGDDVHVHARGLTRLVRFRDPVRLHAGEGEGASQDVARAPMPGTVIAIAVEEGQQVSSGDPLVIIESMKLETTIKAWRDGIVESIHVSVGRSFDKDAPLLTLVAGDA